MSCRLLHPFTLPRLWVAMLLFAGFTHAAFAQAPAGDWAGTLVAGAAKLRVVLHIKPAADGKLLSSIDTIDQGSYGIPGGPVTVNGKEVSTEFPSLHGAYHATLSADGKTLDGTWTQGTPLPLVLTLQPASADLKPTAVDGDWAGTIRAGGQALRCVIHVHAAPANKQPGVPVAVTFDSIDQGALGLGGENGKLDGKTFTFDLPVVHGHYTGTLSEDGNSIHGTWDQGQPLTLDLTRAVAANPSAATPAPASPPVPLANLKPVLDHDFAPLLDSGILAKSTGGGVAIGVFSHGARRVFNYGAAQPDSLFEIGSITKTFTGLALAEMVVAHQVSLSDPVRALLPPGTVAKPDGAEITLLDLITHHSGLPRLPDNMAPADPANPYADYDTARLYAFLAKHGVVRPANPQFEYSNLGVGLLGHALALRAGVPYAQLIQTGITAPLHMDSTAISLNPALAARFLPGHNALNDTVEHWDLAALQGAGAIKSSAGDLLTYLEAQLHPEKFADRAAAGSPLASLPAAMKIDHEIRYDAMPRIALAWMVDASTQTFQHDGGTGGFSSLVEFNPDRDLALAVLYNCQDMTPGHPQFVDRAAAHIMALLHGDPVPPLSE